MEFTARGKTIRVYGNVGTNVPIVYLNTVRGEGKTVWDQCRSMGCPAFFLVEISNLQWEHDMSPWPIPPVRKGGVPCTGGADAHLALLTGEILPAVEKEVGGKPEYSAIAGYSLAGLFAVYASCHTDVFARIASVSGSLWFPGFMDYVKKSEMGHTPEKMYFSLGDREAHTKNSCLAPVEEQTRRICEYYSGRGIPTTFVLNPGNHFTEPDRRMAEGIRWMLEDH